MFLYWYQNGEIFTQSGVVYHKLILQSLKLYLTRLPTEINIILCPEVLNLSMTHIIFCQKYKK